MKKLFIFSAIAAVAALFSSCGAPVQPEQLSCNPNPLTVVGGKVNAEITGTFPAKKFAKNAVVIVTPVLKYDGKEALGEPVTYIGEKVKENGKTVNYKKGGTYSQSASFDFVPEMAQSELYLRFEARKGKKAVEIPDVKVADGVNQTSMLVNPKEAKGQVTADKFQRIIQEMQEADILFLIQQANLRDSQLNTQEMKDLKAAIKEADQNEKKAINNLEVSGYASPDGGMDLNTRLADNRQANAQNFLKRVLRQSKVKADIDAKTTAEDWEGFKKAMEESNIQDKEMVLRVLSMYSDPEEREAQIKNLSSVYKTIADEILPALRRSRLILTTDIIGKSDEEIAALAKNDPAALNVEELLYAATLTQDKAEKKAIYEKVTSIYSEDYRGWNNLGMCYIDEANIAEARRCYAKALTIAPNNADVNYNAGVAAMADGDMAKAEEYLGKAAGTSGDLETAMGTFYTMKGDYNKAKGSYGQSHTNNTAVQQILNEDYAGARKTLAAVENPNATTAYLGAIVGARTNDRDAVYSNMKSAVAQDASMKARAQKDIEFAKYMEDSQFLAIIK
ncbi:MAG: tetratricopeptide repeat protein [Paludibacteraceae bacterium]|nr:tetratricopeptide repeat protein [Paludibacteraceae bacterium]